MGHTYSHQENSPPGHPTPEPVRGGHPLGTSLPPTSYINTTTSYVDSTTSTMASSSSTLETTASTVAASTSTPSYTDDCTSKSCLYFTFSKESTILFQNWRVESDFEFWMAMGGIIGLALLYEMVCYLLFLNIYE